MVQLAHGVGAATGRDLEGQLPSESNGNSDFNRERKCRLKVLEATTLRL
jgi:hypothetical protein